MGGGEKKENGTEVENDDIHGTRTTPMKYMYYMYLNIICNFKISELYV